MRQLARQLGRSPSTIILGIARNGGRLAYRAASSDARLGANSAPQAMRSRWQQHFAVYRCTEAARRLVAAANRRMVEVHVSK